MDGATVHAARRTTSTLALLKPDVSGKPWVETYAVSAAAPADGTEATSAQPPAAAAASPDVRHGNAAVQILERARTAGLLPTRTKLITLSKAQAAQFYAAHAGKPYFDELTDFMSSGPLTAVELTLDDAVVEATAAIAAGDRPRDAVSVWRELMGPSDPVAARAAAEAAHPLDDSHWHVRALFGTDALRNAVHGARTASAAERELDFFFPPSTPGWERTLAVVLPHAAAIDGTVDAIAAEIRASGLHVAALAKTQPIPREIAIALLPPGASATAMDALTGGPGPATILLVEGPHALFRVRTLAGLAPPSLAVTEAPASWHARFGLDDACVGVLAAPSVSAVAVVLPFLFPAIGGPAALPEVTLALGPIASAPEMVAAANAAGFTTLAQTVVRVDGALRAAVRGSGSALEGFVAAAGEGSLAALALAKPAGVALWRSMVGARTAAARGGHGVMNSGWKLGLLQGEGLHASAMPAEAVAELRAIFPTLVVHGFASEPTAYVRGTTVAAVFDPTRGALHPRCIEDVVVDGLTALARAKPEADTPGALRWLGHWLINNNPRATEAAAAAAAAAVAASTAAAAIAPPSPSRAPTSIVFVVAPPAVGKGTQCARLASRFGFAHLSTGDLLRAEVSACTPLGLSASATMAAGGLVSDSLVLGLVRAEMEKAARAPAPPAGFLIDGYPRSLPQAIAFEALIGRPSLVLSYTARDETLKARMAKRAAAEGRADDNPAAFASRLATFNAQSGPVLDFYRAAGGVLVEVDGEGSPDAVFEASAPLLRPALVWVTGPPGAGASTLCAAFTAKNSASSASAGANNSLQTSSSSAAAGATAHALIGYTVCSVADALTRYADGAAAAAAAAAVSAPIAAEEDIAHTIRSCVARGDAPPARLTLAAVAQEINRLGGPLGRRYLLDGVPADADTMRALEASFGPPAHVFVLTLGDDREVLTRATAGGRRRRAVAKRALGTFRAEAPFLVSAYTGSGLATLLDAREHPARVAAIAADALAPAYVFALCSRAGADAAAQRSGAVHLCVSDMLRTEAQRGGSSAAIAITDALSAGLPIPPSAELSVLLSAIGGAAASSPGRLLISGAFPRSASAASAFEGALGCAPHAVLVPDAADGADAAALRGADAIVRELYAPRGLLRRLPASPAGAAAAAADSGVGSAVSDAFAPRVVLVSGGDPRARFAVIACLVRDWGARVVTAASVLLGECARHTPGGGRCATILGEEGTHAHTRLLASTSSSAAASSSLPWPALLLGELAPLVAAAVQRVAAAAGEALIVVDCGGGGAAAVPLRDALLAIGAVPLLAIHSLAPAVGGVAAAAPSSTTTKPGAVTDGGGAAAAAGAGSSPPPVFGAGGPPLVCLPSHLTRASPALDDAYGASVRPLLAPSVVLLCGGGPGVGMRTLTTRMGLELGVPTLRVADLLAAEALAGEGSRHVRALAAAAAAGKAPPSSTSLAVLVDALHRGGGRFASTPGGRRAVIALEGYPAASAAGYPAAHDQVFALEEAVGPVLGAIVLHATWSERERRHPTAAATASGAKGTHHASSSSRLRDAVEAAAREQAPIVSLFRTLGKAVEVDTTSTPTNEVFERVKPFLSVQQ